MKLSKIILFLAIITACTPQQRFNRLIKHHPELIKDSVMIKIDTIIKHGIKLDTVYITKPIDSLIIDTAGVDLKVYRVYDTLRVKLHSKTDTIFVKNSTITKYIPQKNKGSNAITYLLAGALLMLIVMYILKK